MSSANQLFTKLWKHSLQKFFCTRTNNKLRNSGRCYGCWTVPGSNVRECSSSSDVLIRNFNSSMGRDGMYKISRVSLTSNINCDTIDNSSSICCRKGRTCTSTNDWASSNSKYNCSRSYSTHSCDGILTHGINSRSSSFSSTSSFTNSSSSTSTGSFTNSSSYYSRSSSYSTNSSSSGGLLTYSSILSADNRQRCQASLRSSAGMKLKPYWPSGVPLDKMRQAGVLVALCTVHGQPSFLFTLRSKNMSGYSGHVSFPGGMVDKDDKSIVDTVLRESDEEIGIKRSDVDVWGTMMALPGQGFDISVTPVLGFCGEIDPSSLKINPSEVSEVFTCSVESLCLPMSSRYTAWRGVQIHRTPAFDCQKYRIWGLTAVVLHQALLLVAPGLFKPSWTFRCDS